MIPSTFNYYHVLIKRFEFFYLDYPASNHFFKLSNTKTWKSCEISSKFTIETPERRQRRRSGVFVVDFDQISQM